jgi:ATP-binding cassette, subfamily B, bacterial
MEIGVHDLLFTSVGTITALATFIKFDWKLGLLASFFILLILTLAIKSYILNNQAFIQHFIKSEDRVKNIGLENLAQMTLIRSTFAGNEANRKLRHVTQKSMYVERASWSTFYLLNMIMRMLYFGMLFFLILYLFSMIKGGVVTPIIATSLIITFFNGTYDITKVGRRVYWFVTHIDRVKDLFTFLSTFGKQTFPVLGEHHFELPLNKKGNTSIEAKKLKFRYNVNAQIFNDHSLILTIPYTQKNKLYGIIGPSGVGKTTLLSILGGQLKPQEGTVTLNGIDIYSIDDYARRTLITIQNQTASTMRGTVRYNLLFGMPQNKNKKQVYSDEELNTVLKKVGLWKIFKEKEGLETFIGEGGFTISGGQRQRFNFASVYLRAKYYEPILILMDEPTSSLDEVSETAITDMISELAHNAATFVIAHRLHTIKDAAGLLDISLIKETKKMRFYPPETLKNKSHYYQNLLKGTIEIND